MMQNITFGAFLFFPSMTVIAMAFVYFLIPETKGVPLEDMNMLWVETSGFAVNKRRQYDAAKVGLQNSDLESTDEKTATNKIREV